MKYERMEDQTSAKVLSDKEGDGRDVEIAKPFRECGERDSCGALGLYVCGKGRSHTEERDREDEYHDCESGGRFCRPGLN